MLFRNWLLNRGWPVQRWLYTWSITCQSWRHNGLAVNRGIFCVTKAACFMLICLCITMSTLFDFVTVHFFCLQIYLGKVLLHGNAGISRRLVRNHFLYRHAPCYMSLKTSVLRLQLSTVTGTPLTGLLLSQTLVLLL